MYLYGGMLVLKVRKSRIMQIIFFVALVCLIATFPVSAKIYGSTIDGITWSLDLNNGEMVVSGEGNMPDYLNYTDTPWYKPDDAPWGSYITLAKTLIVDEGITSIGKNAFIYARELESVTLAETVATIGENAFAYCHSLSEVKLPSTLFSIGANAFASCKSLEHISLPATVTGIGAYAFSASALVEVDLSGTCVTYLNEGTFAGCKSLSTVVLPRSLVQIGTGAFYGCAKIDESTGKATEGLAYINIPASVSSIGEKAFFACTYLSDVSFASTPDFVGEDAFYMVPATYKVTFKNDDGSVITSYDAKIGSVAEYTGETPTKQSTLQYYFRFKSWDRELEKVFCDTEYTATYKQYDANVKFYVTWIVDGQKSDPIEYKAGDVPKFWGYVGNHTSRKVTALRDGVRIFLRLKATLPTQHSLRLRVWAT